MQHTVARNLTTTLNRMHHRRNTQSRPPPTHTQLCAPSLHTHSCTRSCRNPRSHAPLSRHPVTTTLPHRHRTLVCFHRSPQNTTRTLATHSMSILQLSPNVEVPGALCGA